MSLYGADGYFVEEAPVGTLIVGALVGTPSFGSPVATPTRMLTGGSATLTAEMLVSSPSGPVPAPAGTTFEVQFQPNEGAIWTKKLSGQVQDVGSASATVTPAQTGYWRFSAGSVYNSSSVLVEVGTALRLVNLATPDFVLAGESIALFRIGGDGILAVIDPVVSVQSRARRNPLHNRVCPTDFRRSGRGDDDRADGWLGCCWRIPH